MSRTVIFALLFSLFLALAGGMPTQALAEANSSSTTDECADGNINKAFQSSFAQAGQAQIEASNNILGMFGAVDLKAQYCWSNIQNMLSFAGSIGDPFKLIWSAVSSQITNLLNQVCSQAMSAVSQLKSFLMSQLNRLCIPMPNLGLSIGGLGNLGLKNAPSCNGISLFSATSMPAGSYSSPLDYRTLLPRGGN